MRVINKKSRNGLIEFYFDIDDWFFPVSFQYTTIGNRHRPWTFRIGFLCFELIICIHEDAKTKGGYLYQ